MKKIISYLLVLIMLVPCIVLADYKYDDGVKKTDLYIFTYNDYARYIKIKEGLPYGFNNGKAETITDFKYGGFITKPEYDITNSGQSTSWLAPGIEYWLVGKNKLDTRITSGNDEDKSGVRITEYVLHNTKVNGAGTITNPWTYIDGYNVKVGVTDKTIGQILPEGGYEHVSPEEGAKEFILTYDNKYPLDTRQCENAASATGATFNITNGSNANTKKITVSNVTEDFSCFINFGTNCYAISFNNNNSGRQDGLYNQIFYYQYGKGWFNDSICKTPFNKTITSPTRLGYLYQSYNFTNDKEIITIDNKIKPGIKDEGVVTGIAYAKWKPIVYNISYNYNNGGAASGGKYPSTGTYDQLVEVTPPVRTGYTFTGWSITGDIDRKTAKTGTVANVDSLTTSIGASDTPKNKYYKNLASIQGKTVTFKATWSQNVYNVQYSMLDSKNNAVSGVTINPKPGTGKYDLPFQVGTPAKGGYTFDGWTATGITTSTSQHGTSNSSLSSWNGTTRVKSNYFKNLNTEKGATVTLVAHLTDTEKPTCTATKDPSTLDKTTGVTINVTCSDNSGSCTLNKTRETGKKTGTYTYTVTDPTGNSNTCSVSVTEYNVCTLYKQCQNSACGAATCRAAACGVESYKSCANASACGYNSCRNSACGVQTYATCTTSGCGCGYYAQCTNAACGPKSCPNRNCGCASYADRCVGCQERYCKSISYWGGQCISYGYRTNHCCSTTKVCDGYNSCPQPACGYKSCSTSACGCNIWKSCPHPNCGVLTYNSCRTAACGAATCSAAACGVAQYKSCANASACGYNSCRTSGCGCQTTETRYK